MILRFVDSGCVLSGYFETGHENVEPLAHILLLHIKKYPDGARLK
jgi:hypothetical protein